MLFYNEVIDAFKFTFSDYKTYFQISCILFILSIIRGFVFTHLNDLFLFFPLFIISEIILYIQVGYGSYLSLYTLKGRDYLPKFQRIKRLFFEGLKKSFAIYCYLWLIVAISTFRVLYLSDNLFIRIFIIIIGVLIYLVMILGLMNRYLHQGSFIHAFNFKEMYEIFKNIKIKNFILVIICVFFAQLTMAQCTFHFTFEFTFSNVILLFIGFFISPAVIIFTKRLTALHLRQLFADSKYSYKLG